MADKGLLAWQAKLTPEELRELTSRAGKASVKKKAEKRKLRDYLEAILTAETDTGDVATDVTVALIKKALQGDVQAYNTIRDTLGQKPTEEISVSSDSIKISIDNNG